MAVEIAPQLRAELHNHRLSGSEWGAVLRLGLLTRQEPFLRQVLRDPEARQDPEAVRLALLNANTLLERFACELAALWRSAVGGWDIRWLDDGVPLSERIEAELDDLRERQVNALPLVDAGREHLPHLSLLLLPPSDGLRLLREALTATPPAQDRPSVLSEILALLIERRRYDEARMVAAMLLRAAPEDANGREIADQLVPLAPISDQSTVDALIGWIALQPPADWLPLAELLDEEAPPARTLRRSRRWPTLWSW